MERRVGTSGFSYKEWKGPFYPEKLAAKDMLRFYAERLGAVEINNTFYRMPKREVVAGWAEQVPDEFRFVLKASRRITHQAKLRDCEEAVGYLFRAADALSDKLGAVLFQLPPYLKKDVPLLREFLALVPEGRRAAVEFRSTSWLDDAVYDALRERDAALCVADFDEAQKKIPLVSTASWGYLRLRAAHYEDAELTAWNEAIDAQGWDTAFVFFKHEDEGVAPVLAARLLELAADGARHGPKRATAPARVPHRVAAATRRAARKES